MCITDKISDAFLTINKMFNSSCGDYLYEGKFIDKDSTFIDLHISNGAMFMQPIGSGIVLKNV